MIQDGEGVYSFPGGNVTYNGVSLGSTATYRTSVDYRVNGAQILESTCEDEMWTPEAVMFLLLSPTQSYTSLHVNGTSWCFDPFFKLSFSFQNVLVKACCYAISLLLLHLIIGHVALLMVKLVCVLATLESLLGVLLPTLPQTTSVLTTKY